MDDQAIRSFWNRNIQNIREFTLPFQPEYALWSDEKVYNGAFEAGDLELYYSMLRFLKPARVIEVGSGSSTLVALEALRANGGGSIIAIDPEPRQPLPSEVLHHAKRVEEIDPALFTSLNQNDVLFIDSSHTAEESSYHRDILDGLRTGVYVHHHDFVYPRPARFPEEQIITEYYLARNQGWGGLVHNALARSDLGADEYTRLFPHYSRDRERVPGSIWTRKNAP